ncbi:Uncharacterized protein HSRCO_1101 [Halanaeroarchaeum sp. HSR-CO]|uniref:hypothetical protein n=1 Tax=Halanaeroarchaeum sp. HSR-CO TaxID=2866382 RepID=UPI00217DD60F|nr:hypothetical protein [Halanaeroarchaeum sp. HSR-CO]UWG47389.1 Uncharacterized protein HSRCO_1101 [Halanaeroarchaeum sp. HSR-CO]
MKVDCPTCGYEFETASGLGCPRCGDQISCSSVGCSECDACSTSLSRIGRQIRSRVSFDRSDHAPGEDS